MRSGRPWASAVALALALGFALGTLCAHGVTAESQEADEEPILQIAHEAVTAEIEAKVLKGRKTAGAEPISNDDIIFALKLIHRSGTENQPVVFLIFDGADHAVVQPIWYADDKSKVAIVIPAALIEKAPGELELLIQKSGSTQSRLKHSVLVGEAQIAVLDQMKGGSISAANKIATDDKSTENFYDPLSDIELAALKPIDKEATEEKVRETLALAGASLERREYHTTLRTLQTLIDDSELPVEYADSARVMLARILLSGHGRGLKPDRPRAVSLLQEAAELRGYPDAQALLAFLYASGYEPDLIPRDSGKAFVLWNVAAQGGSLFAQMALGFKHRYGIGVPQSCQKAARFYREAALQVVRQISRPTFVDRHPGEPVLIDTPASSGLEEVIQHYQQIADRGDVQAQLFVGRLNYYGAYGVPQDLPTAIHYFALAADAGDPDARVYLASLTLQGNGGLQQDYGKAYELFESAAKSNKEKGRAGMGYMLLHGLGVPTDEELALEYLQKSPKNADALYSLALLNLRGQVVKQDVEQAMKLFDKAAQLGNQLAMFRSAEFLLQQGSTAFCNRAVKLWKEVAELGPSKRAVVTALQAFESKDDEAALFRYLFSAYAGHDTAQYNAAYLYENSIGTMPGTFKDDPEYALELYDWASKQAQPEALLRVGDLIYEHRKDYRHAASVYRNARNAEAMFNLGVMHARGLGVPADLEIAKRWFDQANEASTEALIPTTIALAVIRFYNQYQGRFAFLRNFYTSYVKSSSLASRPYDDVAEKLSSGGSHDVSADDKTGRLSSGRLTKSYFSNIDISLDAVILATLGCSLALVLVVRKRRLFRARSDQTNNAQDTHEHFD